LSAYKLQTHIFRIAVKMSEIPAISQSLKESDQNSKAEYVVGGHPTLTEAGSSKGKPTTTSLYDLIVPTFLQTVSAVGGFLDRTATHCAETGANPDDFVDASLFHDMAPFHFQIECVAHHSVWGLESVKNSVFDMPPLAGSIPFADLRAMISQAEMALKALKPDEVNSWSGRDLDFQIGPRRLAFTSETFLLSFSLPNFYFHAVTAYNILRNRGVPLGKRDFEGQLRTLPNWATNL
jgi:hypothetical protein